MASETGRLWCDRDRTLWWRTNRFWGGNPHNSRALSLSPLVSAWATILPNQMLKPASCWSANSGTQSSYLIRFLLLPMIRSVLSNMYEMEQSLAKTQDINWTVVRPPGLKNLPATGERGGCGASQSFEGCFWSHPSLQLRSFWPTRDTLCPKATTSPPAVPSGGETWRASCCLCWTATPGWRRESPSPPNETMKEKPPSDRTLLTCRTSVGKKHFQVFSENPLNIFLHFFKYMFKPK